MNSENIKKAFDLFVEDKFTEAKEILKEELAEAKAEYINKKLGLVNEKEKDKEVVITVSLKDYKNKSKNEIEDIIFDNWCEGQKILTIEYIKLKNNKLSIFSHFDIDVDKNKLQKELQDDYDEWVDTFKDTIV